MSDRISTILVLSCLLLAFSSCAPDAPHDNPLDPLSPDHKTTGVLTGKVMTLGLPYTGIAGASVLVSQDTSLEVTSSDGSFSFQSAPSGNLTIIASKDGYLTDTVRISLSIGQTQNVDIYLDALPVISNAKVITSKIDQWLPGPVYSVTVTANVVDPDAGDLDSVYVMVDSVSFTMFNSVTSHNFQATIQGSQLPGGNIQWLVGKEFEVYAVDRLNGRSSSGAFYVSRVIESEAIPTSPTNLDTTSSYPQFNWNGPGVTFNYSYIIEVYQLNSGTPVLFGNPVYLNSSQYSYDYPDSLPGGKRVYFWTIAVVDGFGNSAQSIQASFVVR